MKLQDKFKKYFIMPLIFGILLSIILTVTILIFNSRSFTDQVLLNKLAAIEEGNISPILYTANNVIYKKFQKTIYSLQLFHEYYSLFAQSYINNYSQLDLDTINKYVKNSLYMQANLSTFEAQLQQNISDINYDNSTYLNYAFWHYDNIQNDLSSIDNAVFNYQVGSLANMIPVMRSVFETNNNNLANDQDLIYFASESTSLFFIYPIFYPNYFSNQAWFDIFKNLTNSPSCTNANGVTPGYFYFQCRLWWQQVVKAQDSGSTNSIVITDIYKFVNTTSYSLTVCIKFPDPLVAYYSNVNDSLSTICSDININYVYDIFDHFNKEITGYFYVVKVSSQVPLYYPLIIADDMYSNLERFEYELDTSYYIEELNNFDKNTLPLIIREYDDSYIIPADLIAANKQKALQAVYQGSYMKNGTLANFTIYPIKLYCDYDNYNTTTHIFSIISVSRPSQFKGSIESYLQTFYARLILQIFLFMIIASILILISWYLIISISTNIVKPIENLKYLIQGMQMKDKDDTKENEKNKEKRGKDKIKEDDRNNSNFSKKTKIGSARDRPHSVLLGQESGSSEDSDDNNNDDFDLDEDTAEIRSAEMSELFEILLQLKNVLTFTTNFSNSSNKNAFFNYVHAKYTFNQVSNYRGKMICDSNVGNLAMRLNKYDKAIFHFFESLPAEYQKLSSTARQNSIGNVILILNEMYANTKQSSLVILNPRESKLKLRKRISLKGNSRRNTNSQNFLSNNEEFSINNNNSNNMLLNEFSEEIFDENVPGNRLRSNTKRQTKIQVDSNKIFRDLSINKDLSGVVSNIRDITAFERTAVKAGTNKLNIKNEVLLATLTPNSPKKFVSDDENISVLIESRYPKLIYAYKKFFKSLRKLIKKMKNEKSESSEYNNIAGNNSTWLNSNSNTNIERINHSVVKEVKEFQDKIGEYINIDLHVLKDKHSLEAFECIISDFLFETIKQKDSRRVAEIILEYIEFLLVYKLKFDSNTYNLIAANSTGSSNNNNKILSPKKSSNNFNYLTNQSNIEQEFNSFQKSEESSSCLEDIFKYKTDIINEIGKYFQIFDKIFDNISMDNSSSHYYKTFLDKFKTHKKENQSSIETPPKILYQKSNYLKGKLAKYCGHYDKALEYFHRSRETTIICDASLIKKSIKQIIKIMSYIKAEIERDVAIEEEYARINKIDLTDINYASSSTGNKRDDTAANNKDEYSGMKAVNRTVESAAKTSKSRLADATKAKIVTKIHRCEEIDKYINLHLSALNTFEYSPKDLLLLIDVSASMHTDKKKIERALKNANYIFENYVTSKDRFALFYYSKNINPMISLTEKNYNTYTFVKSLLENLTNSDLNFGLDENIPPKKSSHMCRAISLVYDYLKKKSFELNSYEKWIVIFTDSFKRECNTQKDQEILWNLKNMKEVTMEQIHIIVVGINMEKDGVKVLLDLLNDFSKKSAYIDIDNVSSIKSLLKIPGKISEDFLFMNEKYECDKEKFS